MSCMASPPVLSVVISSSSTMVGGDEAGAIFVLGGGGYGELVNSQIYSSQFKSGQRIGNNKQMSPSQLWA